MGQLRKGLALVANLPEGVTRMQHELDLQIALGKAMIATNGYGAPETGEAFNRARSLCEQLDRPPQLVSVLHGQWVRVLLAGDLALARSRAEELLTLGTERNDPVWTVMGCRISGVTCCWLGESIAARDYLERGLLVYDSSLGHRRKLLRAIAELNDADESIPQLAAAAAPLMPAPIPTTAAVPPPITVAVESAGERRYVTVMFCDLVGSTSISAGLDAEE